jgi:hypothetical protein
MLRLGRDRGNDKPPTDHPVQAPPRAASSTWTKLSQLGRTLYSTGVWIAERRSDRLKLHHCVVKSIAFPWRQAIALCFGARKVNDCPHHKIIPRLVSSGQPTHRQVQDPARILVTGLQGRCPEGPARSGQAPARPVRPASGYVRRSAPRTRRARLAAPWPARRGTRWLSKPFWSLSCPSRRSQVQLRSASTHRSWGHDVWRAPKPRRTPAERD